MLGYERPDSRKPSLPVVDSVAFLAGRDQRDEPVIASVTDGNVTVWTARSGSVLLEAKPGGSRPVAVALGRAAGNAFLATGSEGGTVAIWNLDRAERLAALTTERGVVDLWFVTDEAIVIALTNDGFLHAFELVLPPT